MLPDGLYVSPELQYTKSRVCALVVGPRIGCTDASWFANRRGQILRIRASAVFVQVAMSAVVVCSCRSCSGLIR